ncbi:MAG: mannose-1-phosphate guanylyltransferase [Planctomycetaceae bacterium]|nr:mannose-1-phosphate guanylyltransferase [Planctomycetaceae bacterium]
MLHAVIMAGGAGTRFWPASRSKLPKQLLHFGCSQTMLQSTVARLDGLVPQDNVMVVTNQALVAHVSQQLPGLAPQALLGEPCKRDTAACIGMAAAIILKRDPKATLLVMPADHQIETVESFQRTIQHALRLIEDRSGRLVTFGIRPTYAAESFGYIERGDHITLPDTPPDELNSFQVRRFREKPTADLAREFLADGNFLWNAGIFVWKASTIDAAIARFEPEMHEHLRRIVEAADTPDFAAMFQQEFSKIQGRSIDYAVMERHEDVVVVEAPFNWDDVGSWQAVARTQGHDADGNTVVGKHLGINTTGCIVHTDDEHLIVTLGLQDCLVIRTPDATFVANKHDEEAIRDVVAQLRQRGWTDYL